MALTCYASHMDYLNKNGDGKLCPMAVIVRNKKVLMGLRNYTADKWKNISVWTVPGGRSESGEKIKTTLTREVKEEVDLDDLKVDQFLGEVPGMKDKDIVLMYLCNARGEPKLMEPEKFSEWKWFAKDEIPENFVNPLSLGIIKKYLSQ